jgi:RNA polymerase sigma-70 factor (ECF subfamily)
MVDPHDRPGARGEPAADPAGQVDPAEVALVARARMGDVEAFGALVTRHQQAALRTAFAIGGSESEADDITQEAFVKAFRALPRFQEGRPLRPWLLRIVANEARNRRRSRGRRERLTVRAAAVGGHQPGSPEELALSEVSALTLRSALARLDERDRTVIALRYFAGLSEAETAAALDVPAGTVKSRLSRALDRLRDQLGEEAR